ncbi:MAG: cytidine deaminase [Candidatus Azobacteroides sp.]|nr:cytidine deaminase [Candidatus Azobacteroides sp.]
MKTFEIVTKVTVYHINDLNHIEKKIIFAAKEASEKAYSPYSGFNVGCAVMLETGEFFTGNNQENAAYPSGLCAERVTMMYANANRPDVPVIAMGIAVQQNGVFLSYPTPPCGGCRQVLLETENRFKKPIKIYLFGEEEIYMIDSVKDILPLGFDKEMLLND